MKCFRCDARPPVHTYVLGADHVRVCTRCWEALTQRQFNWQPPINPAEKLIAGLPGVQPRLI